MSDFPPADDPGWRQVAYHEAGHAVAALLLGRRVTRLRFLRSGPAPGICEVAPHPEETQSALLTGPYPPQLIELIDGEITWRMAGPRAHKRHEPEADQTGWITDIQQAEGWARMLAYKGIIRGDEIPARVEVCWERSGEILEGHWDAVELMVSALLDSRDLSEEVLRAIVFPPDIIRNDDPPQEPR